MPGVGLLIQKKKRYLPQHELVEFCKQEGIQIIAHQPLGGKPIAAVNPNASRPGPLVDHKVC